MTRRSWRGTACAPTCPEPLSSLCAYVHACMHAPAMSAHSCYTLLCMHASECFHVTQNFYSHRVV